MAGRLNFLWLKRDMSLRPFKDRLLSFDQYHILKGASEGIEKKIRYIPRDKETRRNYRFAGALALNTANMEEVRFNTQKKCSELRSVIGTGMVSEIFPLKSISVSDTNKVLPKVYSFLKKEL